MIWDCVLYSGEREILAARLRYLNPVVDKFVVLEGRTSFSKKPKKVDTATRKSLEKIYGGKIVWNIYTPPKEAQAGWEVETWARNEIANSLLGASTGDLILLGDVDEVPSIAAVLEMNSKIGVSALLMKLYRYDIHLESKIPWVGTVGFRHNNHEYSFQELRNMAMQYSEFPEINIISGGWHLSSVFNSKELKNKVEFFSHRELDRKAYTNILYLKLCYFLGSDLTGSDLMEWTKKSILPTALGLDCSKRHLFLGLRRFSAKIIQPYLIFRFSRKIGTLSNPKRGYKR
jgi:hypothetical protein